MAVTFPVSVAIQAIDNATAKTRAIAAGIQKATSPLTKLSTSFSGLAEAAQFGKLQAGFAGVGDALGELAGAAKRAAFLVGGIAAAAGGTVYALVHGFAEAGDSAIKAAQKIGIGVEKLQELRYAAQLGNVETEALDTALIKLTRNAALSARGSSTAAKGFDRLGISVLDGNGHLRDAGSLLEEIADKFGRLDDPLKKAALAQELFGKAGADLIPLLSDGAEGLRQAAAEAHRFGIVLSRDAAQKGEAFMDNLTRVSAVLRGVRNVIGAELLPVVEQLANAFREWVVSNLPRVRDFAQRLARDLPKAIMRAADAFATFWEKTEPVRVVLGKLYDLLGPVGTALGVLAGVLVVTLAPAVLSVVAALATLSAALVGTPAGWVVLVLTAVAAAFVAVGIAIAYVISHWDDLAARFPATARALQFLGKVAMAYIETQLYAIGAAAEWVFSALFTLSEKLLTSWQAVADFFSGLWSSVQTGFEKVYGFIVGKLEDLKALVPDWALKFAGIPSGGGSSSGPTIAPKVAETLAGPSQGARSETTVRVDFQNVPRGTRVSSEAKGPTDVDLSMGYALSGP
jgi:hypothetical protein